MLVIRLLRHHNDKKEIKIKATTFGNYRVFTTFSLMDNDKEQKEQEQEPLLRRNEIILLSVLAVGILLMPIVLTQTKVYSGIPFNDTGQIGDTIGGITAPLIGLLSAVLVYITFKAQIRANKIIFDEQERLRNERRNENLKLFYLKFYDFIHNELDYFTLNTFSQTRSGRTTTVAQNSVTLKELIEQYCKLEGGESDKHPFNSFENNLYEEFRIFIAELYSSLQTLGRMELDDNDKAFYSSSLKYSIEKKIGNVFDKIEDTYLADLAIAENALVSWKKYYELIDGFSSVDYINAYNEHRRPDKQPKDHSKFKKAERQLELANTKEQIDFVTKGVAGHKEAVLFVQSERKKLNQLLEKLT